MFANPNYYTVLTQRKYPSKETVVPDNAFGEYEVIKGRSTSFRSIPTWGRPTAGRSSLPTPVEECSRRRRCPP